MEPLPDNIQLTENEGQTTDSNKKMILIGLGVVGLILALNMSKKPEETVPKEEGKG